MWEEMLFKYAFFWGPLMIFFFAVGWGVKTYGPVLFAAWTTMLKETVAALTAASTTLTNAATVIEANTVAMQNHREAVGEVKVLWNEMRDRIDSLQCAAAPRAKAMKRTTTRKVRVIDDIKKAA